MITPIRHGSLGAPKRGIYRDNRLDTYDGVSVQYDADGNMVSGPLNGQLTAYTFNSRNQLTVVGTSSYTYDAEGNRIAVNLNGIQYTDVINPNAALSQLLVRTGPETQVFYVYGLGLIGEQNGTDYEVYHYDLRGSTVLLTDLSGATTDSYQYGPYGELLNHTGSSNTQFLYNGRDGVMTDGNGLYYMRARYYSPEIQRFVSRDSYAGSIVNPMSLNLYTYCENKPINRWDPSGHDSVTIGGVTYEWGVSYTINGATYGDEGMTKINEGAQAFDNQYGITNSGNISSITVKPPVTENTTSLLGDLKKGVSGIPEGIKAVGPAVMDTCHDPVTVPALKQTAIAVATTTGLGSIRPVIALAQAVGGVAYEAYTESYGASTVHLASPSTIVTITSLFK